MYMSYTTLEHPFESFKANKNALLVTLTIYPSITTGVCFPTLLHHNLKDITVRGLTGSFSATKSTHS